MKAHSNDDRAIEPALRVLLVLAAAELDANEEWQQLRSALAGAEDKLIAHVVSKSDELIEHIRAEADARISCKFVPPEATTLLGIARSFAPNLVHISCRGCFDGPARLTLTTRSEGSVELDSFFASELSSIDSLWLLILNSYREGGSNGNDLVDLGVPAVLEQHPASLGTEANRFTGALYRALLTPILRLLPDAGVDDEGTRQLSSDLLLSSIQTARLELSPSHRDLVPAELFVRRPGITLRPRAAVRESSSPAELAARTQLATLRSYLARALASGAPASLTSAVREEIHRVELGLGPVGGTP
jgi:hypothetical protein